MNCQENSPIIEPEATASETEEFSQDYCSLFENMLNGFAYCKMVFDQQGRPVDFIYLQVNEAFEKLTGLRKEVVLGKLVTKAIPGIEKSNPELFEIYGRVASTGIGEKFEFFLAPLNTWFFISVYSPKKKYFVAIFENITESKTTSALLQSSMERFMTLADSLPEIVFETDLTGKLTYVNKKAFEITGYTDQDLAQGLNVFSFISPKDLQRAKTNFANTLFTCTPTSHEYVFVRKNGSEYPVIIKSLPIKVDNKPVGKRGLIIDISREKKIIDQLAFQAQLLEAVGQAIIATDKERVVRYWNNGAKNLYGWLPSEAIGRDLDELLTEFYNEEGWEIYKRLASGEIWSSEIQVKRRDGSIVSVIANRYPVIVENNELIGSISLYTDITDRKALETRLAEYVEALAGNSEKINDLNDKLLVVGNLTRHDIRNKLSALNGLMYLLKKKIGDNPACRQNLADIEKVSKQLVAILDFQKTYEQVGSEKLVFVDVAKFFNEAVALISDTKNLTIDFKCLGLEVLADSLLRQVIYNFIDNTLKHGVTATSIRLHCQQEQNNLLLIYEDNGPGIAPEMRSRLFQKGFGKGTGIGLYMIKRIVETYGWTIEETGQVGVGVKFCMKIPGNNFKLSPLCSDIH